MPILIHKISEIGVIGIHKFDILKKYENIKLMKRYVILLPYLDKMV